MSAPAPSGAQPARLLSLSATSAADPAAAVLRLQEALGAGAVVALPGPGEEAALAAALAPLAPAGPAVVLGSGGSRGGRRWMQLPLVGLEAAADGLAVWLRRQGLDPAACLVLDPLPLHHVSGLLPWLRARRWGASLRWLAPELMRDPAALAAACPLSGEPPALLSLVPIQLRRLLESPEGVVWLRSCGLIWVGGAALPGDLASRCRELALPLAPCYGSTETGAMVAALEPARFLAGEGGCGMALPHGALRIDPGSGAVQVCAASLAAGEHRDGRFLPLALDGGWWSSGDLGRWGEAGGLELLGRLDGAINSGGETVFPEQVEAQLVAAARARGLPLRHLLLLGEADPLWGERLVALVRAETDAMAASGDPAALLMASELLIPCLQELVAAFPPSQRPRRWLACPELAPSALGKWQRRQWQAWLLTARPAAESGSREA